MRRIVALIGMLPLLLTLLTVHHAAACGAALELGVRTLQDVPVAQVAFDIDVDREQRTMATDAGGLLQVTCVASKAVRIVAARSATGQALLMDENSPSGGLAIPLIEGQTIHLPLRLTDNLLFVEPIAEGVQSAVLSGTPVAAAFSTAAGAVAPAVGATLPIPTPARPPWFWWVVALSLGVPAVIGGAVWLRRAARGRRAR